MLESVTISPSQKALPRIEWRGMPVVTTESLAEQFGTEVNNLQANFTRNKARFIDGKHFFRIAGKDLEDLRLTIGRSQISPKTRALYLWTKRGASRHARMLETEEAWDIYELLEDAYFGSDGLVVSQPDPNALSTVADREPLYILAVQIMVKHGLSLPVIYRALAHFAGVESFKAMLLGHIAHAGGFGGAILAGTDSGAQWRQLESNRIAITGHPSQSKLDLGPLVLGSYRAREVTHA